ncbi:MAG: DUF1028 domain-containing protein [candidate division WOR-3 bacterium]
MRRGEGTFSIVAFDPTTGDLGVAVASKFLAVGSVVPWAEAGVGAIATQAFGNTTYGPRGLALLKRKLTPEEVIQRLTREDKNREQRQVGIVDAKGRAATYTGKRCIPWAGGLTGKGYAVQGNILTGEEVVKAMAQAFERAKGELAERLLTALKAGEQAGGDSRGKQSAALLVVRKGGGYAGYNDRYVDLRVDDHPNPIPELERLLKLQLGIRREARAYELYDQKKYKEATKVYEQLLREDPQNAHYHYNYACVLALLGQKARAIHHLRQAFQIDPSLLKIAARDTDLDSVRNEPEFQQLIQTKE